MDVSATAAPIDDEPDPRAIAAERLTFFADAVIAIAITLLALELPVPQGRTNHDLFRSVYEARGDYIGFLISFYVIAINWSNHHRVFRYVTRIGGRLSLYSLLWLLMQVITPFATKVLTGEGGFQFRFILYATVQALAGVFFILMVHEIQKHRLYRPDIPPGKFGDAYFGSGIMTAAFLVSIPVAFVSESAYDIWVFVPIGFALIRKILQRRADARLVTGRSE